MPGGLGTLDRNRAVICVVGLVWPCETRSTTRSAVPKWTNRTLVILSRPESRRNAHWNGPRLHEAWLLIRRSLNRRFRNKAGQEGPHLWHFHAKTEMLHAIAHKNSQVLKRKCAEPSRLPLWESKNPKGYIRQHSVPVFNCVFACACVYLLYQMIIGACAYSSCMYSFSKNAPSGADGLAWPIVPANPRARKCWFSQLAGKPRIMLLCNL